MARSIHRLSAARVGTLKKPGLYADGGNLWLRVKLGAGGINKSWLFRFAFHGREHLMGLGPLRDVTLAEAREQALVCRKLLREGIDPIQHRRTKLAEQRVLAIPVTTFKRAAQEYIAVHEVGWRSAKHSKDWVDTLDRFVNPIIGDLPVSAINVDLVLQVLRPIWDRIPDTASRIRGRIEMVFDACAARGLRDETNPARWAVLKHFLPKPSKVKPKEHHEALPLEEVGEFMAELRKLDGPAPRALEFCILTATRSGETRLAKWDEIDGNVWTVPSERTKTGREHRVPLCGRTLEILVEMQGVRTSELVFPGHGGPAGLRRVLDRLGRDITVHGFRSTFRDWCGARSNFPREVAEMALAHRVGNTTEQAYARSDYFEKRRHLMDAWAAFCAQPVESGEIVVLHA
jgi:integrase